MTSCTGLQAAASDGSGIDIFDASITQDTAQDLSVRPFHTDNVSLSGCSHTNRSAIGPYVDLPLLCFCLCAF